MAGKGSRQRTYGKAFEDNFDRIFGKKADPSGPRESIGVEWVSEVDQFPREARELAQKAAQELLEGDANGPA